MYRGLESTLSHNFEIEIEKFLIFPKHGIRVVYDEIYRLRISTEHNSDLAVDRALFGLHQRRAKC